MSQQRRRNSVTEFAILLLTTSVLTGCGETGPPGPTLVDASGSVLLEGQPLADADVSFIPLESTEGIGGRARTNESGQFEVQYLRGGTGLPSGTYRVTVSKRVMPDGSPVAADDQTDPIESPAMETLPPAYSNEDQTKLKVVVEAGKPIEITLKK